MPGKKQAPGVQPDLWAGARPQSKCVKLTLPAHVYVAYEHEAAKHGERLASYLGQLLTARVMDWEK